MHRYAASLRSFGAARGQSANGRQDHARPGHRDWRSQHNHTLLAARTTIQQNQAQEVTANLRPNPTFFTDWEYLPLFIASRASGSSDYLHDSTEGDIGLSYLFERGKKRAASPAGSQGRHGGDAFAGRRQRTHAYLSGGPAVHQCAACANRRSISRSRI